MLNYKYSLLYTEKMVLLLINQSRFGSECLKWFFEEIHYLNEMLI